MADKSNIFSGNSKKSDQEKQTDLSRKIIKLQVSVKNDDDVDKNLNRFKKEMHEKRLEKLREQANKLKEDSWKYPSVDQLLGL